MTLESTYCFLDATAKYELLQTFAKMVATADLLLHFVFVQT